MISTEALYTIYLVVGFVSILGLCEYWKSKRGEYKWEMR